MALRRRGELPPLKRAARQGEQSTAFDDCHDAHAVESPLAAVEAQSELTDAGFLHEVSQNVWRSSQLWSSGALESGVVVPLPLEDGGVSVHAPPPAEAVPSVHVNSTPPTQARSPHPMTRCSPP